VALGSGPCDFVGCAEPGNAPTNNDDPLHILLKKSSECLVRLPAAGRGFGAICLVSPNS
jgi:hypothetical protein